MTVQRGRITVGICTILWLVGRLFAQEYIRDSRPELFPYDELVRLGSPQELSPELAAKLHTLTTTPFINNEAFYRGARPHPLEVEGLGPTLRVAFWNIERGLELDDIKLFLTDKDRFMSKVVEERKHATEHGKRIRKVDLKNIPDDIEVLKNADVWILNEVDWGVKRTQYREVVRELGETLNMNWAYGVEFLEVDSKQLGTDAFDYGEDQGSREKLLEEFKVDKDRLRALHGNAVLSRYPIRSVRLVPFTIGYDWFKESGIRPLEKGKRKAAILIGEDLMREVRRGQRTTLFVDLDVPEIPGQRLTIASTHLENRAKPKIRRQQLNELLKQVHEIPHPIIVAGDLNTTGSDSTPTSVENMLYKRYGSVDFWTTTGVQWATGVGLIYTGAKTIRKLSGIQYQIDPTSANIPGASPNLERGFFSDLENFRFDDGKAFDFRGVPGHMSNSRAGTLGDSNERGSKGFAPSFEAELIWKKVRVAKFKLDWIFGKGELKNPRDANAPYIFAPHFARTMSDLNNCLPEPISDHSPMTVDLPFQEPKIVPPTPSKSASTDQSP
jgi:endonuclease/exonuclease/phosphatase family metal-dependent hydrolase